MCEESCVARYRHVHLSPDFTSQEFWKGAKRFDDYTVVIVSGNTNRGDAYLNKLGEVKRREINGSDSYVMACME